MAKDPKNESNISKEEKKKLKSLAKEEKKIEKMLEKEEKRRSKEELKMKKKEEKILSKQRPKSSTDVQNELKTDEIKNTKSETQSVKSNKIAGGGAFKFMESRFVMPRGQKGYVFPVTPGPARYPVTRINYPVMKARRQVDLTKKMIAGQRSPAYTMGIKHSEIREFYNKIQ